jgi:hypothetical protein
VWADWGICQPAQFWEFYEVAQVSGVWVFERFQAAEFD